ncbi:alginate export family protein [Haloferula sp. A504]|uniref:alginate export family protein n=1 Tax=Haloferula sp. A504 TaxID=3373601 RepID=UPI0031C83263|nr:alginate export family protein [Verrucomicrobiaceae bacterium E54]
MLLYQSENLTVRGQFQAGLNLVAETNLFWDLASRAAGNTAFEADTQWLEGFIEPGLGFERRLGPDSSLFGKLSAVGSYTAGTDAFDTGDVGRFTLEEAYLGYRADLGGGWAIETSLGSRALTLGTGMLIANGGADGFERGALKFGPREAWEMAGILQVSRNRAKATAFYLEPNEMASNDTANRMAGIDLRWDGEGGGFAGLTYLHVLESEAPYPQAAPGGVGAPAFLPGARDGLNTVNFYGRTEPFEGPLEGLALALDAAWQWNDRIDLRAWGGRIKAEYTFAGHPWRPVLSYSYQVFSGDDPKTRRLERFDPLYYDGAPKAWATGSKSAMVFINSNVQAHHLTLAVTPTQRDIITLRYAHVRAHQLRSPVQFGQATRVDFSGGTSTVVSGVTDAHLSDDFFLEYTRVINPHTFLTGGFSISIPGKGIDRASGGDAPNWTGAFLNVVVNY